MLGLNSPLDLTKILAHWSSPIVFVCSSAVIKPPHSSPTLFNISGLHNEIGSPTILTQTSFLSSSSAQHPLLGLQCSNPTWIPSIARFPEETTRLASSKSSNSSRALSCSNLANPKLPLRSQDFAQSCPNFSSSSSPPELSFQLATTQCSNFFNNPIDSSLFASTTITFGLLDSDCFAIVAYDLPTTAFSTTFPSWFSDFLPRKPTIWLSFSAMVIHPLLSLLPLGMKMQNLFLSRSETPSRINPPALFIPRVIEYILPCSFHSLPHLASFSSLIQRFSPSKKNPRLSDPNWTHDETPPFFSTMRTWIFLFLSSTTISNALDSTAKLHSFLLLREL
ncbi:uncharacterized protein LOC132253949 [Vitis vinifera]|uniref:uncharacterized protein LOC132253949 n=1 Tax=Vitis vinifera TaxID=29760 RepID=UPI002882E2FB|nr:uncharacterized protein LOC132253949 [Vitis vinifera]